MDRLVGQRLRQLAEPGGTDLGTTDDERQFLQAQIGQQMKPDRVATPFGGRCTMRRLRSWPVWLDEADARQIEQQLVVEVMRSADAQEGLAAFGEKRAPGSTGR
ncbi:hypothetical protein ACRDU6_16480 [Mycolicibacterium sp. ELW1]|uniref:hypothetical protein n=1 Tax=unclassified Mycolicibacterium TaxID=2636767 RepID=UPI001AEF40B8|nr:hypothetical protein [Mycobacterium sp. ELW1]